MRGSLWRLVPFLKELLDAFATKFFFLERTTILILLKLVEVLTTRSEFAFLIEWQKENRMPVDAQDRELSESVFSFLESYERTIFTVEAILVEEQKKTTNVTGLFREDTIGVSLLVLLWTRKEGKVFMEAVIVPIVDQILALDYALEVILHFYRILTGKLDYKKSNRARRNLEDLQRFTSQLLNGIASSENYLSRF